MRILTTVSHLAFVATLLTTLLSTAPAARAQTGRLAYIQNNGAYIGPADGYAPAVRLPGSDNAVAVSLSPTGSAVLVFAAASRPQSVWGSDEDAKGLAFKTPYRSAIALGPPLDQINFPHIVWSNNGEAAFVTDAADTRFGRYTPADGKAVKYPVPVASVSADGAVVAYLSDNQEVRVRFRATGKEKVLFSPGKPQALFAAARRAKNPKGLPYFLEDLGGEMASSRRNWAVGTPAITPDGKTVFFATNGGSGMGASGNCTFAFFSVDVATGNFAILSKVGEEFGRVPFRECSVSPDGQRLMYVTSMHASAVENPSWVTVIDLPTQKERILTRDDPTNGGDANALAGACWSPDGKYVAYSQAYFDVAAAMKRLEDGAGFDLDPAKYTLYIKDAATGRRVRMVPGATWPSWGK